jgi:hypothetical protein
MKAEISHSIRLQLLSKPIAFRDAFESAIEEGEDSAESNVGPAKRRAPPVV